MIKICINNFSNSLLTFQREAGEKELREIIEKTYPELTIKSIQKTQYNDLYEILYWRPNYL